MQHVDRIYGLVDINEPVLLNLIACEAVQRLRGVLQHGISGLIGITRATTRYEHSLGVLILARHLGASLEEQIAALLHDVSHTAFSHVIDYVFNDYEAQGFHEEHKQSFVARSDLPKILASHGYDWRDFLDDGRFSLLEQPAPALCADRLDYFLRDSVDLGLSSIADIRRALAHLVVHEGRIMCDDLETARWMGYTYIQADQASWANFREVGLYELTARAIRRALELGVLDEQALWSTDEVVWARLHTSRDPELQERLSLISPLTRFAWDEDAPDFCISTKLRTIDPEVKLRGAVQLLSEIDPGFASHRNRYLQENSGKWPMRVIR
ncbi:MAG: HD domain-containing protein [Anaerolineales bacterium]|nr:HD domain-containing protein [Anaerolineales bacterium]